ncbi:hypothetical protein HYW72_01625 [Candidatus Nomurabacteria bacterium]|nr:hypothetical protein [Candidatus Nomurabacteria bacterium]
MEDFLLHGNSEYGPAKTQFLKDLAALRKIYPEEILALVHKNMDILLKNYVAWQQSLGVLAKNFGIETADVNKIPGVIEQISFEKAKKTLLKRRAEKIILGISGPGAVGKEIVKDALGFDTVVNTTTRPKRDYEKEDQHYHFVTEAQFRDILAQGGFVIDMERKGRGQYGIQKQDVDQVLSRSKISIIEENPENLASLGKYIKIHPECQFILIYILPPSPILLHLAARLAGRCQKTGENFRSAIISTLGIRQLKEFNSISIAIKKEILVVFAVNDDVECIVKKIKDLVTI